MTWTDESPWSLERSAMVGIAIGAMATASEHFLSQSFAGWSTPETLIFSFGQVSALGVLCACVALIVNIILARR